MKSCFYLYRIVSEAECVKLSKLIEPSYYKEVGVNLEIPNAELGQIIMQHLQHTNDALMTVFTRWRDKQPPGTVIRTLLTEGLQSSDLWSLSGELLAGSLVPNMTGENSRPDHHLISIHFPIICSSRVYNYFPYSPPIFLYSKGEGGGGGKLLDAIFVSHA